MIELEPLLISVGLRLAICLSPLSTCQPCICLGEVEEIAEEWKSRWTWRKRETRNVTATPYKALYPETDNGQYEYLQNIEVHHDSVSVKPRVNAFISSRDGTIEKLIHKMWIADAA
jgi:hypothetical protein